MLWWQGRKVGGIVVAAGATMAVATIIGTILRVMGPPATLVGLAGSATSVVWGWRARRKLQA